ncbi:unnamed protein product [Protopolystoma xenopodis]|uniref:Uncharacterized protein n=1 Tax=Protopolystoma xenopodis TaxID=117903 RepID=A0A3S5CLD3_9PLAT|nr:unnamed protein product [Protopolystoma xenopodis]
MATFAGRFGVWLKSEVQEGVEKEDLGERSGPPSCDCYVRLKILLKKEMHKGISIMSLITGTPDDLTLKKRQRWFAPYRMQEETYISSERDEHSHVQSNEEDICVE